MAGSAKPRGRAPVSLARAQAAKPGRGAWYALVLAAALALGLLLLTVMVVGSYLAPVFDRSWLWLGTTLLLALGVPLAVGLWLVRPLAGFKRAAWLIGVCVIVPLLAVVGLSAGAPRHTATQLRKHGHWPFEQVFGPPTRSSTTRFGESLAATWASLLHGDVKRNKTRAAPTPPEVDPRARPKKTFRKVFYSGIRRPRPRPVPAATPRGPKAQVPFVRRGAEIMVPARLALGRRDQRFAMMIDTGASVSAIDRVAAKRLRLRLPETPITVELQTAAGPRSFPVAVLDRVRLGRAELRHVTVAICDPCAQPGLYGLIGLNFTRHFVTTIDHKRRRLTLQRQTGVANRIADVEPFLHLSGVTGETASGRFTVRGKAQNRGPRTVRRLALQAVLLDSHGKVLGRLKGQIDRLAPRQSHAFQLRGAASEALMRYRLELTSATW